MTFFRKCSIKKVYDAHYGISTDGVEFSEAVEILAYCLMDGKVDQKSLFETYLYNDLLGQLKNEEVNSFMQVMEYFVNIFKKISKKTMALVWFYLQINGKPNEKLIDELLEMFDRNDFNSVLIWLMVDDEEGMNETELQMKKLILKHFENDQELAHWLKDIFKQVTKGYRL